MMLLTPLGKCEVTQDFSAVRRNPFAARRPARRRPLWRTCGCGIAFDAGTGRTACCAECEAEAEPREEEERGRGEQGVTVVHILLAGAVALALAFTVVPTMHAAATAIRNQVAIDAHHVHVAHVSHVVAPAPPTTTTVVGLLADPAPGGSSAYPWYVHYSLGWCWGSSAASTAGESTAHAFVSPKPSACWASATGI